MTGKSRPELVFGLIGPLGTDLDGVCDMLAESLDRVRYGSERIVLSDGLLEVRGLETPTGGDSEYDRIASCMDRGNELGRRVGAGAAAVLAVIHIQESRENITGSVEMPATGHAYLLKSLKRIGEVRALRDIYGRRLWLISVYASKATRITGLEKRLGDRAGDLIDRDYHEEGGTGHSVREAFPGGDVFVDASDPAATQVQIDRFVDLIFGNTFHTPTAEESGMSHARTVSFKSSSLSRQVGAVIQTVEGDLVSTGVNEVPKAGGGVYGTGDGHDSREFVLGYDSNQRERNRMLADALSRLKRAGWLAAEYADRSDVEIAEEASRSADLSGMGFMDVTEYGREVHAEMDALVGAARRGIPVAGCTMYSTTFPCHICAKHVVASGIRRLVFIEPYPKSHAEALFADSISVGDSREGRIHFKPYFGISPGRYADLFAMGTRKDASGGRADWNAAAAVPRLLDYGEYLKEEDSAVDLLIQSMAENGLSMKDTR